MFPKVTIPRTNLDTETYCWHQLWQLCKEIQWPAGHSPWLIHHRGLVKAFFFKDFDGLLTGDGGEDSQWGRKVQTLHLQVPPPERSRGANFTKHPETGDYHNNKNDLKMHTPWFVDHNVLFPQEALLDHPLVVQELWPYKSKIKQHEVNCSALAYQISHTWLIYRPINQHKLFSYKKEKKHSQHKKILFMKLMLYF